MLQMSDDCRDTAMNMHTCVMIATRVCAVASARASWRDYMHDNDASHKAASDTCECYFEVACMRTTNALAGIAKGRAEAGARSIP